MRIAPELRVEYFKKAIKNGCKILPYDIETSHMLVRTFYIGQKVSIRHEQIVKPSQVISIQYMWATDKKATALVWEDKSDEMLANYFIDRDILYEFAVNVLPQADIVLTQNGDSFDHKVLNNRIKDEKLPILPQKPSIDILKLSRKSFRSPSHKLDYRSEIEGLGGKIKMVEQDWVDIEENGVSPHKKMVPYGCKDTEDTLKLFWLELPYYKDLPVAVEKVIMSFLDLPKKEKIGTIECEYCQSTRVQSRGTSKAADGTRRRFQCQDCAKWMTRKEV